ncbi:hypothetical protein [Staphylococcus agnetis]|uniref:ABC transporter permease n=1 Tax=Staphylococcus agnetis TaxID=985762 RepID=A0ABD7TSD6_9STAP|nr:hypothetical protein [Staphylococcus agnetis]MDG4942830.1 hypothetical protein [Staphylococcus agnetis]OSP22420.1 hypothetical protein B9L42_02060 [Staphylococcus agnetis]OSP24243.1 hypothetical protein B9M87_05270 [Staphylococcus agnetis]OTW30986.1 hypothetical protein B9M88_08025 [Staphylococcus agnetis]UXU57073.1 hypothetical protein MUA95_11015 [Staphylococcus agnetis]
MNFLFKPVFLNTIRMKSVWLMWVLGLLPFINVIAMSINSNFLKMSGEKGTLSGFEYFSMNLGILHNMLLPTIILTFIISKIFYDELNSGIIFMYKDINRTHILFTKWLSIFIIHLIYIFILFVSSTIVYFLFINNYDFSSGTLIPLPKYIALAFTPTITLFFIEILTINFAILLSLNFPTGYTILGVLLFMIFTTIGPMLDSVKYFIPTGYDDKIGTLGSVTVLLISLSIFTIYFIITYIYISYKYKKIEY